MNDIKCPDCGKVFKINETDYAKIIKQIKTKEFELELKARLELAEEDKKKSIEIAKNHIRIEMEESNNTKAIKIKGNRIKHPPAGEGMP